MSYTNPGSKITRTSARSMTQNNANKRDTFSGHPKQSRRWFSQQFWRKFIFQHMLRFIKFKKLFAYQWDFQILSPFLKFSKILQWFQKQSGNKNLVIQQMPTISSKNTCVIQMIQNAWKTSVKPVSLPKSFNHGMLIQSWDPSSLSKIVASELNGND